MYQVSILGLGLIGSRIARHMTGLGDKVTVWNRTPREDFPEAVPSPADAARASKIIQLYLKDRNACLEVFEQMRGALTPEHVILNHSTIDLATVGKLSLMCSAIGCTYVDCPFTGSRLPAEKGELVYYAGTDSSTLDRVRPVLEHSSRDILHLGGIGAGTVVKLVTNMVSATMVQSLSAHEARDGASSGVESLCGNRMRFTFRCKLRVPEDNAAAWGVTPDAAGEAELTRSCVLVRDAVGFWHPAAVENV